MSEAVSENDLCKILFALFDLRLSKKFSPVVARSPDRQEADAVHHREVQRDRRRLPHLRLDQKTGSFIARRKRNSQAYDKFLSSGYVPAQHSSKNFCNNHLRPREKGWNAGGWDAHNPRQARFVMGKLFIFGTSERDAEKTLYVSSGPNNRSLLQHRRPKSSALLQKQ